MSLKKLAIVIIVLLAAILGVQIYALLTAPARERAAGKAIVDGAIEEVQARMDAAKVEAVAKNAQAQNDIAKPTTSSVVDPSLIDKATSLAHEATGIVQH